MVVYALNPDLIDWFDDDEVKVQQLKASVTWDQY